MTKERILSLFYDQIIKEASYGRVDCFLYLNVTFTTRINNDLITTNNVKDNYIKELPTLNINNKDEFDRLLIDYVDEAISFYDKSNFNFLEDEPDEEKREDYLIKYIICTLFANIPLSDFSNPNEFIKNRISMFHNKLIPVEEEMAIGYLESIGATLHLKEEQSPIRSETPYRIKSYLEYDDGYILELPSIYAGKTESNYYLYGIQGGKNQKADDYEYIKQIRKGFIAKYNGAPEHYLFTFLIFISLCNENIIISPFLIERINGNILALERKIKNKKYVSPTGALMIVNEEESVKKLYLFYVRIYEQIALYFTKLATCSQGINVKRSPFENDDKLYAKINSDFDSRIELANELRKMCKGLRQGQNLKKINIVND